METAFQGRAAEACDAIIATTTGPPTAGAGASTPVAKHAMKAVDSDSGSGGASIASSSSSSSSSSPHATDDHDANEVGGSVAEIVCYGLGPVSASHTARLQTALILKLAADIPAVRRCSPCGKKGRGGLNHQQVCAAHLIAIAILFFYVSRRSSGARESGVLTPPVMRLMTRLSPNLASTSLPTTRHALMPSTRKIVRDCSPVSLPFAPLPPPFPFTGLVRVAKEPLWRRRRFSSCHTATRTSMRHSWRTTRMLAASGRWWWSATP